MDALEGARVAPCFGGMVPVLLSSSHLGNAAL